MPVKRQRLFIVLFWNFMGISPEFLCSKERSTVIRWRTPETPIGANFLSVTSKGSKFPISVKFSEKVAKVCTQKFMLKIISLFSAKKCEILSRGPMKILSLELQRM